MIQGVSFLPGSEDGENRERDARERGPDFQQAIKLLSLRMPKFPAGQVLAPAPLLRSLGGSGSPFAGDLTVAAMARMAGITPTSSSPSAPALSPPPGWPSIRPGRAGSRPTPERTVSAPAVPSLPMPRVIPGITTHDPVVQAAMDENKKAYDESPDYGGVPGWTPPSFPVGYEGQSGQQGYTTPLKSVFQQKYENLLAGMKDQFIP